MSWHKDFYQEIENTDTDLPEAVIRANKILARFQAARMNKIDSLVSRTVNDEEGDSDL